jgi:hypothetical protein
MTPMLEIPQRMLDEAGAAVTTLGRVAMAAGRAALGVIRHPETVIDQLRRVPQALALLRRPMAPSVTGNLADWRGEYAYTLAVQAFIYGFPYLHNARLRYDWVADPANSKFAPHAAVNHFWHADQLVDSSYAGGGCPDIDTLVSVAWVDLSDEPVILSHPKMGGRYFAFELRGFSSDDFGYIGQRTTGSKGGSFALVGPGWKGELPRGVRKSIRPAPTPWILVIGRTRVEGAADALNVQALQRKYKLTPLSRWGKQRAKAPKRHDVPKPITAEQHPLGPWLTLNAMLAENPPSAQHDVLLKQFVRLGIGPGLDVTAAPEPVRQSLIRAGATGTALLKEQFLGTSWATVVNGWRYPPSEETRFGDDFLQRAANQTLGGVAAGDPAEAVHLIGFADIDGNALSADARYELHFDGDDLPPVDAFWSLTGYTPDMNLIPNPLGRYTIGDRTEGLVTDPDGGLTIFLQTRPPGADREPNWLPIPAQGGWFAILRLYRPHPEVADAKWQCPGIVRTG